MRLRGMENFAQNNDVRAWTENLYKGRRRIKIAKEMIYGRQEERSNNPMLASRVCI